MIFYAAEFTSVFKTISYEKFKQCRPSKVTAGCKGRYIRVLLVITSHLNFPTLVYTTSAPSTVCVGRLSPSTYIESPIHFVFNNTQLPNNVKANMQSI